MSLMALRCGVKGEGGDLYVSYGPQMWCVGGRGGFICLLWPSDVVYWGGGGYRWLMKKGREEGAVAALKKTAHYSEEQISTQVLTLNILPWILILRCLVCVCACACALIQYNTIFDCIVHGLAII
jgi:hypothetical protein